MCKNNISIIASAADGLGDIINFVQAGARVGKGFLNDDYREMAKGLFSTLPIYNMSTIEATIWGACKGAKYGRKFGLWGFVIGSVVGAIVCALVTHIGIDVIIDEIADFIEGIIENFDFDIFKEWIYEKCADTIDWIK